MPGKTGSEESRNYTEFRIMTRKTPRGRWELVRFPGATGSDFARMSKRLERARAETPGWEFKLESREVAVLKGDWQPVCKACQGTARRHTCGLAELEAMFPLGGAR